MERGTRKLRALLRIMRAISRARDLHSLLVLLARETSRAVGAERSTVFIYDRERDELWSIVAEGLSERIWFDASEGIAGHVFRTIQPLITDDVTQEPRFNPEIDRRTGFTTRNAVTVPIIDPRTGCIGAFQAVNRTDGRFTTADVEFLEAVAAEAAVSIDNVLLFERRRRMLESLIRALAESIEARDPMTAGHSENVMLHAGGIARALGMLPGAVRAVEYAALLHDYGKIGVPDEILRKPCSLDGSESEVMRSHVEHTRRILTSIEFEDELEDVPRFAVEHHERMDGSGYPSGLSGAEISLGGRIIAVADVFEALTAQRHYRDPMTPREAFEVIRTAEAAFDPAVVDALRRHLEETGRL